MKKFKINPLSSWLGCTDALAKPANNGFFYLRLINAKLIINLWHTN